MITHLRTGPQLVGSSDFEVCYEQHWWPMVRPATGLLGDRATAEDAVQEAFTAVHRRWPALVLRFIRSDSLAVLIVP